MSLLQKLTTPSNLSETEVEEDRIKWQAVIDELNLQVEGLTFELVRCRSDGYWYIVPNLNQHKKTIVNNTNLSKDPDEWEGIVFSDKQFSDEYHSWSRSPESKFILDIIPNCTGSLEDFVGRFSYHPFEKEFLPSFLTTPHAVTINKFGNFEFNQYQRGIYIRKKKIILIRPYYNPCNEEGEFDPYALFDMKINQKVTQITMNMLIRNGIPSDITIMWDINNEIVKKYLSFC